MRIEAEPSLKWEDVVKVMVLLGFKPVNEERAYLHMRKGSIHAIVRPGFDGVEVHSHEDRGRSPGHPVLEESKRLVKFRDELQTALREWETLKRAGDKPAHSLAESIDSVWYCPFYRECPSFNKDNFLCTYRFSNRRYCQEFVRLKRKVG